MLLGRLALKLKMITKDQLKNALNIYLKKKQENPKIRMGEIFLEEGMLTAKELKRILNTQKLINLRESSRRLGDIALANGFLDKERLKKALEIQAERYKTLGHSQVIGEILLEKEWLNQEQLDSLLQAQSRLTENDAAESAETKKDSPPFTITIAADRLSAYLHSDASLNGEEAMAALLKLVKSQKIKFGLRPQQEIAERLAGGVSPENGWLLAEGVAMQPGEDGSIEYLFDINPLKTGRKNESGDIDFRDRGEIPQVSENDLLAIRSLAKPGENGTDIFGKVIKAPKVNERKLAKGKGVKRSDDQLQALATLSGTPFLSKAGSISVLPILNVKGNIGYESGHIDFNGDIQVSGGVDDGFQVKGGKLTAKKLGAATIDIKGDIVIFGGIVGANIRGGGSLKARFIHQSTISVAGELQVEKEIFQSNIDVGEGVQADRCDLHSTTLSTCGDITITDIGSEAGLGSTLKVGLCHQRDQEIERCDTIREEFEREIESCKQQIDNLHQESEDINLYIGKLAQIQDRSQQEISQLRPMLSSLTAGSPEVTKIHASIAKLEYLIKDAEKRLEALFIQQDALPDREKEQRKAIAELQQEIETIADEKAQLLILKQQKHPQPTLYVHGTIYSGNLLEFKHEKLRVDHRSQHISLFETRERDHKGRYSWKVTSKPI